MISDNNFEYFPDNRGREFEGRIPIRGAKATEDANEGQKVLGLIWNGAYEARSKIGKILEWLIGLKENWLRDLPFWVLKEVVIEIMNILIVIFQNGSHGLGRKFNFTI